MVRATSVTTAVKNKVSNLFSAPGIELEKEKPSGEKKLMRVLAIDVEGLTRFELQVIVEQIRSLNHSIRGGEGYRTGRRELVWTWEPHQHQRDRVTGGEHLLSVVGDVRDFPDEGEVA